jgi:hypothetical protein
VCWSELSRTVAVQVWEELQARIRQLNRKVVIVDGA